MSSIQPMNSGEKGASGVPVFFPSLVPVGCLRIMIIFNDLPIGFHDVLRISDFTTGSILYLRRLQSNADLSCWISVRPRLSQQCPLDAIVAIVENYVTNLNPLKLGVCSHPWKYCRLYYSRYVACWIMTFTTHAASNPPNKKKSPKQLVAHIVISVNTTCLSMLRAPALEVACYKLSQSFIYLVP